jgi:hypothetical protein
LTAIPKLEGDNKDMEEDNIHAEIWAQLPTTWLPFH